MKKSEKIELWSFEEIKELNWLASNKEEKVWIHKDDLNKELLRLKKEIVEEIFELGEKVAKERPKVSFIYTSMGAMDEFKKEQKLKLKFLKEFKNKVEGVL